MVIQMQVIGTRRLSGSLRAASVQMLNMRRINTAVAAAITGRAKVRAPKLTGRLAASGRAASDNRQAATTFNTVYAGVIHNGWPAHNIEPNPFAARAVREQEPQILNQHQHRVDLILARVHGI